MVKEMKVVDIIEQYSADEVEVVRNCDTIDTLWGLDFIKLTDNDIKALQEGKYLYTDNGEYAQLITYESQEKGGVMMTKEEKIKGLYSLKENLVENPIELEGHKSLPITIIDYAIEAIEQESRWIPVSERLPEAEYGESDSVLVCFEDETQDVLYFNGGNWCYPTGETYVSVNHKNGWHNKVIAWMPLPKPYELPESEDKLCGNQYCQCGCHQQWQ